MSGPIVLLTDFGVSDPFVGVIKGVILSHHSQTRILDLTHHVPPQDVRIAAFYLMTSVPYFPEGTIFVCIVDPGVGSERRILWARTGMHQFLAPDNGLLSWVERQSPFLEVRSVSNSAFFLERVSMTFHGRDVFAPVAAELAGGLPPRALGPKLTSFKRIPFPQPRRYTGRLLGSVLAVDRFGNVITNILAKELPSKAVFYFKDQSLGGLRTHYTAVNPGRPLAVAGSAGFVELSVRNGSFAQTYGVGTGDPVEVRTQ